MERKYEDGPRPGERVGAEGWCTACGAAWKTSVVDGREVCAECGESDDQEEPDSTRLRNLLADAGLSQRGAARALDLDERTMRRYCAGDTPVPKVVWLALDTVRCGRATCGAKLEGGGICCRADGHKGWHRDAIEGT